MGQVVTDDAFACDSDCGDPHDGEDGGAGGEVVGFGAGGAAPKWKANAAENKWVVSTVTDKGLSRMGGVSHSRVRMEPPS